MSVTLKSSKTKKKWEILQIEKKRVLLISTLAILDPLEACGGSPGDQALIILLYFFSQT